MSNQTNFVKGYYSILQYVPDPERAEGVNVGIVLLCSEKGFLKAKTSKDNQRVRRLFRSQGAPDLDLNRLTIFKEAFAERVVSEATRIHSLEDFQRFIDTRANQLRLTTPRSVKVQEPETELTRLFELLVEEHWQRAVERPVVTKSELRTQFGKLLEQRKLNDRIQHDVEIELPSLGKKETFAFAFQNGQPNVIQPVAFGAAEERDLLNRAGLLVVESLDLQRLPQPTKLNVIGSFRADDTDHVEHVRRLLEINHVRLCTPDKFSELIEEIERTAH